MKTYFKIVFVAVLIVLFALGCVARVGPTQTQSETVELEGAASVQAQIQMGAGELSITGGAQELMDAEFVYNVTEWEPEVSYEVNEGTGVLTVQQPDVDEVRWPQEYEYAWHIDLNNDVPIDLRVALGAGTSMLDLAPLDLTALDVDMGAGEVTIDLSSGWDRDIDVSISGGVGELTVRLPDDMGVQVAVNGGLGDVDLVGLQQEGDVYVNDAYGSSDTTLSIDIQGGVGQVNLEVVSN